MHFIDWMSTKHIFYRVIGNVIPWFIIRDWYKQIKLWWPTLSLKNFKFLKLIFSIRIQCVKNSSLQGEGAPVTLWSVKSKLIGFLNLFSHRDVYQRREQFKIIYTGFSKKMLHIKPRFFKWDTMFFILYLNCSSFSHYNTTKSYGITQGKLNFIKMVRTPRLRQVEHF